MNNKSTKTLEELLSFTYPSSGGCMIWLGQKSSNGYGAVWHTKAWRTHRLVYALYNDDFDLDGYHVCHRCDVKLCINPDHLFKGTCQDNQTDKTNKGRQSKGEDRYNSVLNPKKVRVIRRMREFGFSVQEISNILKHPRSTIYNVLSGKAWKHVKSTSSL